MASDKSFWMTIAKVGVTVVGATVIGTWALRRTSSTPVVKGVLRLGVSAFGAYLLRKKAPAVAIGLGTYGVAALAGGAVEQFDMSRYLGMTDQERQALNQQTPAQAGALPQGSPNPAPATTPTPATTPAGNGEYYPRQYAAAGYPTI